VIHESEADADIDNTEVDSIEDMLGIKEGFTPQLKIITPFGGFVNSIYRLFCIHRTKKLRSSKKLGLCNYFEV
jgi:hypothetical protein